MYRPTVRYDDIYRKFVDEMFYATTLDRNQIIRAALFSAAHSPQFKSIIEPYVKKNVKMPDAMWSLRQESLWLQQQFTGDDVNVNDGRNEVTEGNGDSTVDGRGRHTDAQPVGRVATNTRRDGTVSTGTAGTIRVTGGLVYTVD